MDANESNKASCSRMLPAHTTQSQSQWLQSTLSDLDEKIKAILSLLQEEGDSFAQRAEMYYKKRPELIEMLQQLHRSYCLIAERYDHLRCESAHLTQSQTASFKHIQNYGKDCKLMSPDLEKSIGEDPDCHECDVGNLEDPDCHECDVGNLDLLASEKVIDELVLYEPRKGNTMTKSKSLGSQRKGNADEEFEVTSLEREDSKPGFHEGDVPKLDLVYPNKRNDGRVLSEGKKANSMTKSQSLGDQRNENMDREFTVTSPKRESIGSKSKSLGGRRNGKMDGELAVTSLERESIWSNLRLQVSKLMEDNLRQQTELIKRNDEKREAIKELCIQLDNVMEENRALQNCLRCSRVGKKHSQSQISKLKGLILGKLLWGTSA